MEIEAKYQKMLNDLGRGKLPPLGLRGCPRCNHTLKIRVRDGDQVHWEFCRCVANGVRAAYRKERDEAQKKAERIESLRERRSRLKLRLLERERRLERRERELENEKNATTPEMEELRAGIRRALTDHAEAERKERNVAQFAQILEGVRLEIEEQEKRMWSLLMELQRDQKTLNRRLSSFIGQRSELQHVLTKNVGKARKSVEDAQRELGTTKARIAKVDAILEKIEGEENDNDNE